MIILIGKIKLFANKITKEQLMFYIYIMYLFIVILCIYSIIISTNFKYNIFMAFLTSSTLLSLTIDLVQFYDKFFIEKINEICDFRFDLSLEERKKRKQIYLHDYKEIKDIILNFRFLSKSATFRNI